MEPPSSHVYGQEEQSHASRIMGKKQDTQKL